MENGRAALVTLGAGAQQLPLVHAAHAQGLAVVAIDRDPSAPGLSHAEVPIVCSTHDTQAILAALRALPSRPTAVLARSTGKALESAAAIAEVFGLRGLTSECVRIATSKSALRAFCSARGLRSPRGVCVESEDAVDVPLPLVVKPDYTRIGKRAIRFVRRPEELATAIEQACRASDNARAEVEEFVAGIDVSCAFWASRGTARNVALYDELIGFDSAGGLVPIGLSMPTRLGLEARTRVQTVCARFAAELPGVEALLFLCLRVPRRGEPVVIELHADLAGDLIAEELFPAALPGFELFDSAVRFAATGVLPDERASSRPAAIVYRGRWSEGAPAHEDFDLLTGDSADEILARVLADVRAHGGPLEELPLGLSPSASA